MLGKNYVFWVGRIQFQEITWYVYIFFFQKNNEFFFQFKFSTTELEFNPNDNLICLQIFQKLKINFSKFTY